MPAILVELRQYATAAGHGTYRDGGTRIEIRPRLGQRSGMTPEPEVHTPSVQERGAKAGEVSRRIVLRTARLTLTRMTPLDEAEHAAASGDPAAALRDTRAAEVQWREYGFGPWAIRD